MKTFDPQTTLELKAAAFSRLTDHLQVRSDVQNTDLRNLAGFCRNSMSEWLADAANEKGVDPSKLSTNTLDTQTTLEVHAGAFERLTDHLLLRSDVQNMDLMNLAGFCRNCLANWYQEAASENGLQLTKDGAREVIYGMPYKEWQAKHQKEASPEQQAPFAKSKPHQH